MNTNLHRRNAMLGPLFSVLICLLACWLVAASPAVGANLGNIMPLGDSITDGAGSSGGGYRSPLYSDLTAAGYTFNFVGSATDNSSATLTAAGQTHHEGHSGFVIEQRDPNDPNSGGSGRSGILDNLNSWIGPGGANPNYILLMIGTNDVDLNYYPGTPAGSEQGNRLNTLIGAISNKSTGLRPAAHLIVAEITPTQSAGENMRVQAYNSYVASVVAQHQSLGENVSLVDMYDALNPSTDLNDNLHPNDTGYSKMANVWLSGIQAVPEPGSLALFAIAGVLSLICRGGRRQSPE